MIRSLLIVMLAAGLGSAFGLLSWATVLSLSHPDSGFSFSGVIFVATLIFTLPGAAFLLGVQNVARERGSGLRIQMMAILVAGAVAGAGIMAPVSILMADPPMWLDLVIGAWFGLSTAIAFVILAVLFRPSRDAGG